MTDDVDDEQAVIEGECVCGEAITYRVGEPALCAACRAREESEG
jgi:hypothetical protein